MSLTIRAYTIIGCRIDRSILFTPDGPEDPERAEELLEEWMDADSGFRVVVDMAGNEYAGPFMHEVSPENGTASLHIMDKDILSLSSWRKHTQEYLEQLNLWDPKTFGIHTIVCV